MWPKPCTIQLKNDQLQSYGCTPSYKRGDVTLFRINQSQSNLSLKGISTYLPPFKVLLSKPSLMPRGCFFFRWNWSHCQDGGNCEQFQISVTVNSKASSFCCKAKTCHGKPTRTVKLYLGGYSKAL